jgi:hypothetical protein
VRFVLAAVLVLMLSSLALAAPETHQLGPFTVSFDMNTNTKYQIEAPASQGDASATTYPLVVKTDNATFSVIRIIEYKNPVDSTLQMQGALSFYKMIAGGLNATVPQNVTIDGINGFLISGVPFPGANAPAGYKVYQAQYWLDKKSCECGAVTVGMTSVDIASSYPQDVTMNLLNSLKVEKTGEAAQKTTSSDMPPSQ